MGASFYPGLASTARTLIESFGRDVQLVRESTTPSDPSKPWRGSDCNTESITVRAAVVSTEDSTEPGTLVRRGSYEAWVDAAESRPLRDYDFLIDADGRRLRILDVETVKPADVVVAHRLVLDR